MAGIFVTPNRVTVFHVGDSRGYSYTSGHLIQATTDDSDPNSGLITQVLGGSRSFLPVRVHLSTQPLGSGRMLVATDGLFAVTDTDTLTGAMNGPLNTVPDRLLNVAIQSGNTDDFSVAVVETLPGDE